MTLTPLGEAVLLVLVCSAVIFCPWWIGFPAALLYNGYMGYRAVKNAERLRRMRDEIANRERELRRLLDDRFR